MGVVLDMIGMVKTNKTLFYKETIKNLTKEYPGSSYLVMWRNPMVPRGRPKIDIGCKYNARKVLYFIVTEYT